MLRSVDIQRQLERGIILLKMTSCDSFDKIVVLSLRDLQLTTIFKHLSRCVNVQILYLSGNKVEGTDINKHMYKLKNVRKLDLSTNSLTDLPREKAFFAKMINLEFLALDQNDFATIHSIKALKGAPNLHYLSLQETAIQKNLGVGYRYDMAQLLPNLYALDQNLVMFDEVHRLLENRSIRYHSMNSFSRIDPQLTQSFKNGLSANAHLSLLSEQMTQLSKLCRINNPVMAIQRTRRAGAMRHVISTVISNQRAAAVRMQKHMRGFLCRLRMRKEMIAYFDSIGEIELTMTPDEVVRYRAIQKMNAGLKRMIRKWRWWRLLSCTSNVVSKYYRGWRARTKLEWALNKPLNLRENPSFTFLTEQKYLIKLVLQRQNRFPPEHAQKIFALLEPNRQFKLMKPVDIDLFNMPVRAVLQIGIPPTLVKASTKKLKPRALIQGGSILGMCISQFGDKEQQVKQLEDLKKLKNFFRFISHREKQIGGGVIPFRKQTLISHIEGGTKRKKPVLLPQTDSLLMSSRSSDIPNSEKATIPTYIDTKEETVSERDNAIHAKLLKEGQIKDDFLQINLKQGKNPDLASDESIIRLVQVFLQWNRQFPENSLHFYCGDSLLKQVAILSIQKWYRLVRRVRQEQHEIESKAAMRTDQKTEIITTPNQLNILRCIQLRRAAITIQQYWNMYRLKQRIRMLTALKEYLGTVTSDTLCIEERLYKHISDIQYSCLSNNTIPEAQCFAFDFIKGQKQGDWDLLFTTDSKYFAAKTNRETHEAIQARFQTHCLPNWVVKDNLALSQSHQFLNSRDRNMTNQIFHKTQDHIPTQVLDYNQIVRPENRTFAMNNGLNFVVLHCASIEDAQRRALALAMITLNRKRGDFLKILSPDQLFAGTFIQNISQWWELPEIKRTLPENLLKDLIQPGGRPLQDLPARIDPSHCGFLLSKKDYSVAEREPCHVSILINRQLNDENLQMKLVPPRLVINEPTSFDIDMFDQNNAASKYASTSIQSDLNTTSAGNQQHLVHKQAGIYTTATVNTTTPTELQEMTSRQTETLRGQQDYTSAAIYVDEGPQMMMMINDNMESQRNSQLTNNNLTSLGKQSLSSITSDMMIKTSKFQEVGEVGEVGEVSEETAEKVDVRPEPPVIEKVDVQPDPPAIVKTRPVSTAILSASLKKNLNPYNSSSNSNQALAQKSRKSLISSSYGLRKPPIKQSSNLKVGSTSLGDAKQTSRMGHQQSQTTKESSLAGAPSSVSLEKHHQSFSKMMQAKRTVGQSRVQSGVNVKVKPILKPASTKSVQEDLVYTDADEVVPQREQRALSGLNVKRPHTSVQQIPIMTTTTENLHTLRAKHSAERFKITEITGREYQSSMAASVSLNQHSNVRLSSALNTRSQKNRIPTNMLQQLSSERRSLEVAQFNTQRKSELLLKQVQDLHTLTQKSHMVAKQRVVSQLIQNSIRSETDTKLQQLQQVSRLQKVDNQLRIFERRSQAVVTNQIKNQQRAQSSYMIRSQRLQTRDQARRMSGAVNMLNKVNIEKVKATQNQNYLKKAKSKVLQMKSPANYDGLTSTRLSEQPGVVYDAAQGEHSTDSLLQTNIATQRLRSLSGQQSDFQLRQQSALSGSGGHPNQSINQQQSQGNKSSVNIKQQKETRNVRNIVISKKNSLVRQRGGPEINRQKSGVPSNLLSSVNSNRSRKENQSSQQRVGTSHDYDFQSQLSYGRLHAIRQFDNQSYVMQTGGEVESNGATPLYSVFNHAAEAPLNIANLAGLSIPNFGSQVTHNSEASFGILNESMTTLRVANDLKQKFSSKDLIQQTQQHKSNEKIDYINKDIQNDLNKNQDFVTFQKIPVLKEPLVRSIEKQLPPTSRHVVALPVMAKEYQLTTSHRPRSSTKRKS